MTCYCIGEDCATPQSQHGELDSPRCAVCGSIDPDTCGFATGCACWAGVDCKGGTLTYIDATVPTVPAHDCRTVQGSAYYGLQPRCYVCGRDLAE